MMRFISPHFSQGEIFARAIGVVSGPPQDSVPEVSADGILRVLTAICQVSEPDLARVLVAVRGNFKLCADRERRARRGAVKWVHEEGVEVAARALTPNS